MGTVFNYFYNGILFLLLVCTSSLTYSQVTPYPDQHFIIEGSDSLLWQAESLTDMIETEDKAGIQLVDGALTGDIVLRPQSSAYPFDIGLPSWNGTAPENQGGFRVLIRVPYRSSWSPWLEVGYWKANLWAGQKLISFSGGYIDIDTVILYNFSTEWQFKIEMKRTSVDVPSPTLSLLSLFVSDERTTNCLDFSAILADKPEAIFIPTQFLAQYKISSEYGGRICSPTSVSMVLLSYGIEVDPLNFALDTYDPYYGIFGVWPRVVQNASEYGLQGTVTRYRTWSETREILAQDGRIVMSIGEPLYSGHLIMLAGFNENGDPIVHDPARSSDGYAHVFNKSALSHAWFDKGGVAYTFFLKDTTSFINVPLATHDETQLSQEVILYPNYPNPFNLSTTFSYELKKVGFVEFKIFNIVGELIQTLESNQQSEGIHQLKWDGTNSSGASVSSGTYLYHLRWNQNQVKSGKLLLIR